VKLILDNYWRGGEEGMISVEVRGNDVNQALRRLKKTLNREGVFREMKMRRECEKPFEKRQRQAREAVRRSRKNRSRILSSKL
jgi:small subunit ribosomal protein S21